jgi:hypothetical protein
MAKISNERINTVLIALSMLFAAFVYYSDHNSKFDVNDSIHNEQIKYLSEQIVEIKESIKEINQKLEKRHE